MQKSDIELIGDLVGVSFSKAEALLKKAGNLANLINITEAESGLTPAKYVRLQQVFEFSKRRMENVLKETASAIIDPESVLNYLRSELREKQIESFRVLYLNRGNKVIACVNQADGTVDEAHVHPREILKNCLRYNATGIILAHNHPSGRVDPSPEDLHITRKIQDACHHISVKVLDHVIIGNNTNIYYSFREHNHLSF